MWVTALTGMNLHPELAGFDFVTIASVKWNSQSNGFEMEA